MTRTLDRLTRLVAEAVEDDPARGVFRCRRDVFTDPELFELEMTQLFESGWVYLAHESQIPEPNDYYSTWVGRQPVVITRDKQGTLHGLLNACRAIAAPLPAPSMAGPSATAAVCSRSRMARPAPIRSNSTATAPMTSNAWPVSPTTAVSCLAPCASRRNRWTITWARPA